MDEFYLVSPDRGFRFETFKRASMVCSRSFHTHLSDVDGTPDVDSLEFKGSTVTLGVLPLDDPGMSPRARSRTSISRSECEVTEPVAPREILKRRRSGSHRMGVALRDSHTPRITLARSIR